MEDKARRRSRLILIVGVLLALVAGVGTFVVASASKSDTAAPVATTLVLVAARDIAARTALSAADLKLVKYTSDIVPASSLTDSNDVIGKVVTVPLTTGEPILPGKFAAASGVTTFTVFPADVEIAAGAPMYRAYSITVPDAQAVGGALAPGDIVDLVYTINYDPSKAFQHPDLSKQTVDFSAKIALERVPILARTAAVYTIRTDAATAERLAYLQSAGGTLQMLLRAGKDDRAAGTQGATLGQVLQTYGFKIPEKINP